MQQHKQDSADISVPRASLSGLPSEILIIIFCRLSSLAEGLNFAASFTKPNQVVREEGHFIARTLAQRTLRCPREACQLLADQDESSKEALGARKHPVQQMLRNQRAVGLVISRFENVVVRRVTCPAFDTLKVYGTQPRPKQLTSSERLRFTRAYYQLQSLLCVGEEQWEAKLARLCTLRHLYYLHEVCMLPSSIEASPPPDERKWHQGARSDPARLRLQSAVWRRLDEVYYDAHGERAEDVEVYAMEDGYMGFVTLWDHWQDNLQQVICRLKPTDLGQQAGLHRTDLWISDDE